MHISVQGYVHIGMTENLAEAFYLKAKFNAARGKGVPRTMKIGIFDTAAHNV